MIAEAFLSGDENLVGKFRGSFPETPGLVRTGAREYTCPLKLFPAICDRLKIPFNRDLIRRVISPPKPFTGRVDWSGYLGEVAKPYQIRTVNDVVERLDGRCLLAAEMGTGKTLMACAVAAYYGKSQLIIVPANKIEDWKFELYKWVGIEANHVDSKKYVVTSPGCYVVSYEIAKENESVLGLRWKTVICDECHLLKTHDSIRTKKIVPLVKSARCALLLSGTPQLSAPYELYTQLDALHPGLFGSWYEYTARYCQGKQTPVGWEARGSRYSEELRAVMKTMTIRIKKSDVLKLPELKRFYVEMEMTEETKTEFKKEFEEYYRLAAKASKCEKSKRKLNKQISRMAIRSGEVKLEACKTWIENTLRENPEDKLVLFAKHHQILDALEEFLEKKLKIKCAKIDGRPMASKKRCDLVKSISHGDCRVGVLGLKSCSAGLNLAPGAFRTAFVELDYVPGVHAQAECRVDRLGATRRTEHFFLIAKNTYDEIIYQTLDRKSKKTSKLMDGTTESTVEPDDVVKFDASIVRKRFKRSQI